MVEMERKNYFSASIGDSRALRQARLCPINRYIDNALIRGCPSLPCHQPSTLAHGAACPTSGCMCVIPIPAHNASRNHVFFRLAASGSSSRALLLIPHPLAACAPAGKPVPLRQRAAMPLDPCRVRAHPQAHTAAQALGIATRPLQGACAPAGAHRYAGARHCPANSLLRSLLRSRLRFCQAEKSIGLIWQVMDRDWYKAYSSLAANRQESMC
jgi:hypothetical protein